MGIRYVQTAAYHPSENGMVVQFHRQIKTAPTAHGDSDHCKTHLAMVLLGIRSPLKPDMGCTTAQLVFNTPLRLPGEFLDITNAALTPVTSEYIAYLRRLCSCIRMTPPCLSKIRRVRD